MFDVYINYPPPPPPPLTPPSHQKKIVSSSHRTHSTVVARATASSDRNYSQKTVERATTNRYIEIIPYDGSRGSDYQRVQKVLEKLGGVKSWKVNIYGKLTVSTVQHPETIINALKHEFSSNRRITLILQKTDVSSKSDVSFPDKALQAMGTMVATHASQGLIKSMEYKESTTKEGTTTRAMKFNYVNRDAGTSSTSRSAPRVHNQAHSHPTSRRIGFTTTSKETTRSKETSHRSYY